MGLAHQAWSPRVVLSLSFYFSGWFLWSAGALCVHFPAWASKTHSRRCLRWGTFHDSRGRLQPTWTEQVPCWSFIGFLSKPRNISLFSLFYFLNCKILSLSLSLFIYPFADSVLPRESLDPTRAGPQYLSPWIKKLPLLLPFFVNLPSSSTHKGGVRRADSVIQSPFMSRRLKKKWKC